MVHTARADAGSFRDPSGQVFTRDGQLYRQVNQVYESEYQKLMASGLFHALVEDGLLISHQEVDEPAWDPAQAVRVLQPERIPFISYPYEWCFGQLKDAALHTLAIHRRAIDHGLALKDASAYNIQWLRGRPVLIDTLSFEHFRPNEPWIAYRQFCQHFLAPLALMSRVDVRLNQLLRIHLDGIPLDLASQLLPTSTRLRPGLLMHLHAHAWSQKSAARTAKTGQAGKPSAGFSEAAHRGLIDSLQSAVQSLQWNPGGTTWDGYYDQTNYSQTAFEAKRQTVADWIERTQPSTVWDLGANEGVFSRLAADRGIPTVAFDFDPSCVERSYRQSLESNETSLLPLVLDLTNPSPALGWMHLERASWLDRGPADLVMALALVHHLAIGNNVPLHRLADALAQTTRRWLIVEFVPKSDSQTQRLLATRMDIFSDYEEGPFLNALTPYFQRVQSVAISEATRTLHLLERIPG